MPLVQSIGGRPCRNPVLTLSTLFIHGRHKCGLKLTLTNERQGGQSLYAVLTLVSNGG